MVANALEAYTNAGNTLVTSAIAITEFLAGTNASNLSTLQSVPKLSFVMLDEELAEKAALLQRKTRLCIGDAIHLATALQLEAEYFFTNDKQLAKVAKIYMPVKGL